MNILKKIKYGFQRYKRGYSDEDIWDFDSYLCDILIPVLRTFSKKNMGCPSEFWDTEAKNDECHKWQETLEEMAQGFDAVIELDRPRWMLEKKLGEKEIDLKAIKLLQKKADKGLALFIKYFRCLWD